VNDCCLTLTKQIFSYRSWREQANFQCDDDYDVRLPVVGF